MKMQTLRTLLLILFSACFATDSDASETDDAFLLLSSGEMKEVAHGIEKLSASHSPRALIILTALEEDRLLSRPPDQLFIRSSGGTLQDARTEDEIPPQDGIKVVSLNNRGRRSLNDALSLLRLSSHDVVVRREAAAKLAQMADTRAAALIRTLIAQEKDPQTHLWMQLSLAKVDINSNDPDRRIEAARAIAASSDVSLEADLLSRISKNDKGQYGEQDPKVRAAFKDALTAVKQRVLVASAVSNTIYGLSLGSVLVLAALGLAITFGLMRVINMAHGEMLMLGAYSTFYVREFFLNYFPGATEWYLLFAIPFAFTSTFLCGMALERLVIRHLYGRPLETLLATWGLSLILIQSVRMIFGAQNVTVANPDWLSGGWEILPALVIPYSRIFVLIFTAGVVLFVAYLLRFTSLGLKVRAVTQNREIASSLGISTHRIDMLTFGLGSGLAGLGGVALSQLGNVGPELGQQHIIDSFMVVVLGGVGNILGTVVAGIGLGIAGKILEPSVGAVLGKIVLLALLILFIQWRPQGLFALKGRAAGD